MIFLFCSIVNGNDHNGLWCRQRLARFFDYLRKGGFVIKSDNISIKEVMSLLNMSRSTVQRNEHKKIIPSSFKIGGKRFYCRKEIEAYNESVRAERNRQ